MSNKVFFIVGLAVLFLAPVAVAQTAPVVTITSPTSGSTFAQGSSITFTGTATDAESGDLTASLQWASNLDAVIGNGGSFSISTLSPGTHIITAQVLDPGGDPPGSSSITVTINAAPVVNITTPGDGASFNQGANITFGGTATDAEDGDLAASLAWASDQDGNIGTGASFSVVLSAGTHTITASVTDSGGASDFDSITITVGNAPVVTITGPANGTSIDQGTSLNFTATATDSEDGDLTGSLSWSSNLEGVIGSGAAFARTLSGGTHTITASVTDSGDFTGSASITVTVISRPIVDVVVPDGTIRTVEKSAGVFGLPDGVTGSFDTPISVQNTDSIGLQIGDPELPECFIGVGCPELRPQTFTNNSPIPVFCFGCNGPAPNLNVVNWELWGLNIPQRMSLDVATQVSGGTPDPAKSVRVDVYFARTSSQGGNSPPVANAGADLTAGFGQTVNLNGSNSFDPDGDSLTYSWIQLGTTGGNAVVLTGANTPTPSFTAPSTARVLQFQLTVSDGQLSASDTVNVSVSEGGEPPPPPDPPSADTVCTAEELGAGNQPATATIGVAPSTSVLGGTVVTISANGNDPDNTTSVLGFQGVSFSWEVANGQGVLSTGNLNITEPTGSSSRAVFTAPVVTVSTTVQIAATVFDPRSCGTRYGINITFGASGSQNTAPTVSAGDDQSASKGEVVTLAGSASDPDGDAVTLFWSQVGGSAVTLQGDTTTSPSFTVPTSLGGGAELVFQLDADDGNGGVSSDQVAVTVLDNSVPTVAVEDRIASEGKSVSLLAQGSDPDDDQLTYQWTQLSGSAVPLTDADSASPSFTAPEVPDGQEETVLVFQVEVSDGLATAAAQANVTVRRVQVNTLVFPAGLDQIHPLFQDTFTGVAFVNPNGNSNNVNLSAVDGLGDMVEEGTPSTLEGGVQDAFLLRQRISSELAAALLAQGDQGPIQGFFMIGDDVGRPLRRLDGVGGELVESPVLYFPLARHNSQETVLYYLFNPDEETTAIVSVELFDLNGSSLADPIVGEIPPLGSVAGVVDQYFFASRPQPPDVEDGYVRVLSQPIEGEDPISVKGFAFTAGDGDFASIVGRVPEQTRKLLAPHFFVDNEGGDTIVRLLNTDLTATVSATLKAFDDDSNLVGTEANFVVSPKQLFVGSLKELLQLDTSQLGPFEFFQGHLELTLTGKVGVFQKTPIVIGAISFTGNGGRFRSILPLVREGRKNSIFLHVAQSLEIGMFTGFAILNKSEETATVTIEVYAQDGSLTDSLTIQLEPGQRLIDLLDGPDLFGPEFSQVNGHIKVLSDQPVVTFALFGDFRSEFLSAIESQPVVE